MFSSSKRQFCAYVNAGSTLVQSARVTIHL
jgi:hypothetical protein